MKIWVDRHFKGKDYTIGKLYIDGIYFCDTLEDVDRGLTQNMSLSEIKKIKIPDETAIPAGTYQITMKVQSPKYSKKEWFYNFCKGYMPRLLNVPGYDGILIHASGYVDNGGICSKASTSGCILPGKNTIKGKLSDSYETFKRLYKKLKEADDRGEKITIEIK